jgi:hypothetical protein
LQEAPSVIDTAEVIERLGLTAHPEGGWFKETLRQRTTKAERASGTAIYYLLRRGEQSRWHRIDATEIWHFYAGATLLLTVSDGHSKSEIRLGGALEAGEIPQFIVPER